MFMEFLPVDVIAEFIAPIISFRYLSNKRVSLQFPFVPVFQDEKLLSLHTLNLEDHLFSDKQERLLNVTYL